MRTKILISIICACSLFKIQAQGWEYVCSLTGESLCKVYAQGADTVYVVGKNGLIAQSTNGGVTWDKKYFPSKETLNDIIFCNHEVGFIVGNNGTILRTQDAGSSWEQMTSGTVQNINAIAAFDLNNIWAVGNGSLILHSADMGETWSMESLLSDNRYYLTDVECKENRGYITGQGGIMLKTEDGGTVWEEQILARFIYDEIRFLNITDNKVYALGGSTIIFTEDDVNWNILNVECFGDISSVYFQDDQKGFLVSYNMLTCGGCETVFTIYETADGGNTWKYVLYTSIRNGSPDRNNFAFSQNNKFGYCVLGNELWKTPNSDDFEFCNNNVKINVTKTDNPILILNQQNNELQVNSHSKMMNKIEIITIDGRKIMQKIEQANMLNVNVNSLSKGIYIVNVLFSDKTNYFSKWIKN